jgi:hypothetical protein
MKITTDEAASLTRESIEVLSILFAALTPQEGEPWGRITREEARTIIRALLRLAGSLARAAAS